MSIIKFITDIIEREFEDTEFFLVDVESNSTETMLSFYVDGINGIGIKTCSRLSRTVSREIEESEFVDKAFRYEISSPGADNPLKDIRQYQQHVGRDLIVSCKDGESITGKLKKINAEDIEIEVVLDKKRNKKELKLVAIEEIVSSNVVISFKKVKK